MMRLEDDCFIFSRPEEINLKYYVKRILMPFFDLFYYILLLLNKKQKINKTYNVSICAIFKNEAHNMKEWIEFHKIVGVEHFYMFNNFSNDNYLEILESYVTDGTVTLIEWPVEQGQFSAYEYFYKTYSDATQWVSFLDLDEFITPFYKKNISEWLLKYKNYPCIVLYWKMFGSSGKIEHDFSQLTIEQYTVSWDKLDTVGKVLLNTNYEIAKFDGTLHHSTVIKVKFLGMLFMVPPINEFKKFLKWDIHRTGFKSHKDISIQINHYWSKSFGYYFENKVKRGDVNNHDRTIDTFYAHERFNKGSDYKIFKYMIELKIALGLTAYLKRNE
nr:glycosyltransferase family 92 protein [uncultured Flavobacterium sp.]